MADNRREDWRYFREQVPVCDRWAYFDNAAVAPITRPAFEAVARWSREAVEEGVTTWSRWSRRLEETRAVAAALIGADTSEIALVPNTTAGIGLIAEGLPWQAGDNVVIPADEFPSNQYPWLNLRSRGVETRRVPVEPTGLDIARLLRACDADTRIIAVSWVGYASGWRVDLDALVEEAHRRDVLVLVDAIQALGVFPLDVRATPIDFAAADGHKWMMGPEGAGLLYVRRELLDRLRPLNAGWNSVTHHHDFARIEWNPRPEAARYEGGSQNMVGAHALGASLELLRDLGLGPGDSSIARRVLSLTAEARSALEEIGATFPVSPDDAHRSGILVFDLPGRDPVAIRDRLRAAGVVVNCRGGRLRISPHAYCDRRDIERLVGELREEA